MDFPEDFDTILNWTKLNWTELNWTELNWAGIKESAASIHPSSVKTHHESLSSSGQGASFRGVCSRLNNKPGLKKWKSSWTCLCPDSIGSQRGCHANLSLCQCQSLSLFSRQITVTSTPIHTRVCLARQMAMQIRLGRKETFPRWHYRMGVSERKRPQRTAAVFW